jgi:non-ribosomal peptide synthase protein (TIGR01720 family)
MIPAACVWLDALPLTPNGKLDRRALPAPESERPALVQDYVPPRTPTEELLVGIWASVLGIERVGIHDNFFELGGDSIRSLQIAARATQSRLHLNPRQLFQYQTVAELARVARPAVERASLDPAGSRPAVEPVAVGEVPLTPIQHWFFAAPGPAPHHWNQAVMVEVREPLLRPALQAAVERLFRQHDALRLRFQCRPSGWHQMLDGPVPGTQVVWLELAELPEADQSIAMAAAVERFQPSLDLEHGPLVRVAFCDLGPTCPGRLLIVIHHLVVDLVSWQILLEDLESGYRQLARGVAPEAVELPGPTTTFKAWADQLQAYATTGEVERELEYWLGGSVGEVAVPVGLPVDRPGGSNLEGDAQTVLARLEPEATEALLHAAPTALLSQVNELLLAALSQVLVDWSGRGEVVIDVEGHGREEIGGNLDVSRTVGWFTALFPLRLDLGPDRPAGARGPAAALKVVKQRFRAMPRHGIGYGVLRYLASERMPRTAKLTRCQSEISFNYLGSLDGSAPGGLFGPLRAAGGHARSPTAPRRYLIEIGAQVIERQLEVWWTYSPQLHDGATIEGLADRFLAVLRTLITHAQSPSPDSYAPSDFPLAGLDQSELVRVVRALKKPQLTPR